MKASKGVSEGERDSVSFSAPRSVEGERPNAPLIHELHTHGNAHLAQIRSIKPYNPLGMTIVHNLQLPQDLFPRRLARRDMHHLSPLRVSVPLCNRVEKGEHTFLAMTILVGRCTQRDTVPPLPDPSSPTNSKSSSLKSNLNSTPSSSVASCSVNLLWYASRPPPSLLLAVEEGRGAARRVT